MPWNSTYPNGAVSVKANETPGQQNTTYTEATMNKDHYWNIGSNEDGRHKYVNMPVQASDATVATGMDGIIYLKSDGSRVQGFYRNTNGIYQFIPAFLSGTVSITSTSTFVTVSAIPANCYGDLYIWLNGTRNMQKAHFISSGTIVEAFSDRIKQVGTSDDYFVECLNGSGAVDLNLKARRGDGASGTYNYRIKYWAV